MEKNVKSQKVREQSDRMMETFESTKNDKVMEQSDSWFPARSADLLVACRLTRCHTVP